VHAVDESLQVVKGEELVYFDVWVERRYQNLDLWRCPVGDTLSRADHVDEVWVAAPQLGEQRLVGQLGAILGARNQDQDRFLVLANTAIDDGYAYLDAPGPKGCAYCL